MGQLYPLQYRSNETITRLLRCHYMDPHHFGAYSRYSLLQVSAPGPILHLQSNGTFSGYTNDAKPS